MWKKKYMSETQHIYLQWCQVSFKFVCNGCFLRHWFVHRHRRIPADWGLIDGHCMNLIPELMYQIKRKSKYLIKVFWLKPIISIGSMNEKNTKGSLGILGKLFYYFTVRASLNYYFTYFEVGNYENDFLDAFHFIFCSRGK